MLIQHGPVRYCTSFLKTQGNNMFMSIVRAFSGFLIFKTKTYMSFLTFTWPILSKLYVCLWIECFNFLFLYLASIYYVVR